MKVLDPETGWEIQENGTSEGTPQQIRISLGGGGGGLNVYGRGSEDFAKSA